MEEALQKEYKRRESGNSSSVIPAAIRAPQAGYSSGEERKKDYVAGAVSATDSESESEFIAKLRGGREKNKFNWTPEAEEQLEDVLIKNQFDFRAASREFCKLINQNSAMFYSMDVKQLQLRWTDIEIRKYRLPTDDQRNLSGEEESTADVPRLEQVEQAKPEPIRSVLNTYDLSDEEVEEVQQPRRNDAVLHYNDLEELD